MIQLSKDITENEIQRAKMLTQAKDDITFQNVLREECKNDINFFVDGFIWQYNPKAVKPQKEDGAFILFDFQSECLRVIEECYKNGEDLLTEKSREMGATWLFLIWGLWHFLFDDYFQFIVSSYDEEVVDNWAIDSLFPKIRYMIQRLPSWILPQGFDKDKNCPKLRISHSMNDNAIVGVTGRKHNITRSGRYSAMLLDEFAFWERGEGAWTATRDSVKCRFPISTPNGKLNKFYRLRQSNNIRLLRMHWTMHPLKNREWYDRECSMREPWEVAQELDISYEGSVQGKVYPNLEQDIKLENCIYNPNLPLYCFWDFGEGGADDTALIWVQWDWKLDHGFVIDCYSSNYKEIKYFAPFCNGVIDTESSFKYTEEELMIIQNHMYWKNAIHVGDPYNGEKTTAIGRKSIDSELRECSIFINYPPRDHHFEDRRRSALQVMKKISINPTVCEPVITALSQCRFPKIKEDSEATSIAKKPVHDWTSHYRTAFEYGSDWLLMNKPILQKTKQDKPKPRPNSINKISRGIY